MADNPRDASGRSRGFGTGSRGFTAFRKNVFRIAVIGVEFGYTEVPIADLRPDRLIGHMRDLPGAVESLMVQRNPA